MHATILLHAGMSGHAARFAVHRPELEKLMQDLPGLVSYHLIETAEGVAALVVGRDRAACEECVRRAARWMDVHLPDLATRKPWVVTGAVIAETIPPP